MTQATAPADPIRGRRISPPRNWLIWLAWIARPSAGGPPPTRACPWSASTAWSASASIRSSSGSPARLRAQGGRKGGLAPRNSAPYLAWPTDHRSGAGCRAGGRSGAPFRRGTPGHPQSFRPPSERGDRLEDLLENPRSRPTPPHRGAEIHRGTRQGPTKETTHEERPRHPPAPPGPPASRAARARRPSPCTWPPRSSPQPAPRFVTPSAGWSGRGEVRRPALHGHEQAGPALPGLPHQGGQHLPPARAQRGRGNGRAPRRGRQGPSRGGRPASPRHPWTGEGVSSRRPPTASVPARSPRPPRWLSTAWLAPPWPRLTAASSKRPRPR